MAIHEEVCFVQFIHPGKEHHPNSDGTKRWNNGSHRRKFLECDGRCIRNGASFKGPLRFWAEWEPESELIAQISEPVNDGPRFVVRPYYVVPRSYLGLQNTDPFIFGSFFYTGCQQNTAKGLTQLRYLKRGSVVLFGSCIGGRFALDTVFVVDRSIDHNDRDFRKQLRQNVPDVYWDVTLAAWYQEAKGACASSNPVQSWRLYWGATFENPVDDMFSFFPSMPAEKSPNGFARPVISNSAVVTDNLLQGKRLNRGMDLAEQKAAWNAVRERVEAANLWPGVHAEVPSRRSKLP